MRGVKRSYETSTTGGSSSGCSSASYDLQDVWKRACWKAMGYADDDYDDDDDDDIEDETWELIDNNNNNQTSVSSFQVINLIPPSMCIAEMEEEEDDEIVQHSTTGSSQRDPVVQMAQQIQRNILTMRNWLHQKQLTFIQLTTSDAEASLIQSTITSFTATTANVIESLHQLVRSTATSSSSSSDLEPQPSSSSASASQLQQHHSGIVQILMMELQDTIAIPFQQLTKMRQRTAVSIYQNPIQCRIYTTTTKSNRNNQSLPMRIQKKEKDTTLELLGLDDDDDDDVDRHETATTNMMMDQRFVPTRPSHRLHQDFYSTYDEPNARKCRPPPPPVRPISMFVSTLTSSSSSSGNSAIVPTLSQNSTSATNVVATKRTKVSSPLKSLVPDTNDYTNDMYEHDTATAVMLQQESILLQMKTNNDLDSVQQMEQTMMDITTLLSQFANLVVEQQDNIHTIYDTTATTRDNLQKGTENLTDAKVRVQSSRHYMASVITGMGVILLIFHWLRP